MGFIFLDVEQVLTVIMAELPDGVYASDRADDVNPNLRSYSSSELRAHAKMIADSYANLQQIYSDKFISTATPSGLSRWEKELFTTPQNGALTYMQRQQNLLAKVRYVGGISTPSITSIVAGILNPIGLPFEILPYCGAFNGVDMYGAWVFEFSQLDWDTFLSDIDPVLGAQRSPGLIPLDCSLNYAAAGITQQQMEEIQDVAYTYEVQIYGNADATTLSLLNSTLTSAEPARSTHIITNNATRGPI